MPFECAVFSTGALIDKSTGEELLLGTRGRRPFAKVGEGEVTDRALKLQELYCRHLANGIEIIAACPKQLCRYSNSKQQFVRFNEMFRCSPFI